MPDNAARIDDWASSTSSLGGVRDKHRGIVFARRGRLTREQLEALYEQHPIAARIVDLIVDDAFRTPCKLTKIVGPDAGRIDPEQVRADLDRVGLFAAAEQAARWSRLYGAAIVVPTILNSGEPCEPISLTPDSRLLRFVAVPAERVQPLEQDVGLLSPTYGQVLRYRVDGLASQPVVLDHSRVFLFEPIRLPIESQLRHGGDQLGWGPSVLERPFDDLARYGAAGSHAVSMMYVSTIVYLKLKGYRLAHGTKDGQAEIRKMLASTRAALDAHGMLAMDQGDEIGALTLPITGAADLMDRTAARFAAATPYPKEILFNEIPGGLNAGELSGPQEIYFGVVNAWRRTELRPHLMRAIELYFRINQLQIESFDVEFEPLWTRSVEAESETHARNAAADAAYIDKGVLGADEVRAQRFEKGREGRLEVEPSAAADPIDLSGPDVEAEIAATAPVAAPDVSVQQAASLANTVKDYNAGLLSYNQAIGVLRLMFPGRAIDAALGSPPADPDALGPAGGTAAPAAGAAAPSGLPEPGDSVSARDAAQRYGVPTRTITRLIDQGSLQFWGLGAHRRVSLAEVAALATSHRVSAEPGDEGGDDGEATA